MFLEGKYWAQNIPQKGRVKYRDYKDVLYMFQNQDSFAAIATELSELTEHVCKITGKKALKLSILWLVSNINCRLSSFLYYNSLPQPALSKEGSRMTLKHISEMY